MCCYIFTIIGVFIHDNTRRTRSRHITQVYRCINYYQHYTLYIIIIILYHTCAGKYACYNILMIYSNTRVCVSIIAAAEVDDVYDRLDRARDFTRFSTARDFPRFGRTRSSTPRRILSRV